jgi:hypothetical protein
MLARRRNLEASGFKALLALRVCENTHRRQRFGLAPGRGFGLTPPIRCEPEDFTTHDGGFEDTNSPRCRREGTAK